MIGYAEEEFESWIMTIYSCMRVLVAAAFVTASPALLADEIIHVPVAGAPAGLVTRLCMPNGVRRAPLAVINHGSPANASDRGGITPWRCASQAARYFLEKGYAVAFPLRRGYGETGGKWAETYGDCQSADYVGAGKGTAADIAATVDFLHALPSIVVGKTIVIGHSAGGFGTVALAASPPDGVIAMINVAGGRGGRNGSANDDSTCSPKRLVDAAAYFGGSSRIPMLWLYARNDSFFSPSLVEAMHVAFTKAGGRAQLAFVPSYGSDGHQLFGSGGLDVWGPYFDRYLKDRN